MKFVDEVPVTVESGSGGAGAVSFRREKFVPRGGPDGGDGGRGGSIIFQGDPGLGTLIDFQLNPRIRAESGQGGAGRLRIGKSGKDLVVRVPFGTQVDLIAEYDPALGTKNLSRADSSNFQKRLGDITPESPELTVARGGRGGKGNAFFKSATRQTPDFAQPGESGEAFVLKLSLKLMADIGLVGFPNAGKSSLLAALSAAKPLIGSYPFTTLTPSLGVVYLGEGSHFVAADVPGLIEGAHEGKGLGIRFLKHLERTRALVHVIDGSLYFEDPYGLHSDSSPDEADLQSDALRLVRAFRTIQSELMMFSQHLGSLPQQVIISKADLFCDAEFRARVIEAFKSEGIDSVLFVSSASGENIDTLKQACVRLLAHESQHNDASPSDPEMLDEIGFQDIGDDNAESVYSNDGLKVHGASETLPGTHF
jgi:GTP-binding protein